jgi:hypothetical protein
VPEEAALPTQATPYKPSVQRDPFATPQHERSAEGQDLLDDMTLKGFVRMGGKPFVVVSDRAGHVRWLGVGHRFTDAEITEVTEGHVTFQQWDPHNARRTAVRTIVKTFKREEGKP